MNKTKHAILLILLSVLCNSVGAQTYEGKKKDIEQIDDVCVAGIRIK
ncbi:MAG: hypothetical protein ACPG21_07655 [Crocinitomicaceae bacterium]